MSKKKAIIRRVFTDLPKVQCKGLCHTQCTFIVYTDTERRMMRDISGKETSNVDGVCSNLTADKKCAVYKNRPLICRLYGVTEGLLCPHGCKPERVMPEIESAQIQTFVRRVGGEEVSNFTVGDLEEFLCRPVQDADEL